ncbi:FAD/NAD(P)-binding domain-containing protein [Trichoderma citrinoviride]|uniref:FAD/NAD(P)-binding domain-containing protein n=1 Tax=Trichoderma citrinoviride TaxID=58853 RepID=A0A2T4BKV0_9HYPO|nr:FAD/NAD(P)-binding domain-containing protein [Trichoderma citrinoviride]PTB69944.1 FAD/NAD(P)-binding domain-containing protein [Trichoderma citrinoviride]
MAIVSKPTPSPSTFSIAIIGGGIGGLSMALSLSTQIPSLGKNITVYEQAPAYKEIGAGIGIGVNASRILKRYGVYAAANAISGDRNGIHRSLRRWDNGEEIVSVGAMDDDSSDGVRQLSVHRAEFLQVLYDHLRATSEARLETNKRAVEIVDDDPKLGKTTVRFADGSSASADLVIACDGIHSNVRRQLSKGANDLHPRYSGRVCYRGLLPMAAVERDWPYDSFAVSWLGPDRHFLVFPISRNKTLNVVAFVTKPEEELGDLRESWSSTAPRAEVEAEFAGWEETVQRIVRAMEPNPGKWKLNDRELLDQWVYLGGRVVLSGDAAHAMLPHQGSGAGHAIEDSFVMGQAVKAFFENPAPGLETYMKLYQETRLPRAQKAQLTSRQAGDVYEMQGPEFAGLVFEQRLQVIHDKFKDRMKWVWGHDLEADFNATRTRLGI